MDVRCFFGRHDWLWLGGDMGGLKRCQRCGKWGVIDWLAEVRWRKRLRSRKIV